MTIARYRLLTTACMLALTPAIPTPASAQAAMARKAVRTQDDLPRFTYPVSGTAVALLMSDDATFGTFAAKVLADIDATIAGYDIQDRGTLRGLLNTKAQIELLAGRNDAALATLDKVGALEDKPDAKLLSGLRTRAMIAAQDATRAATGSAYDDAYGRSYAALLKPLPWAIVGNRIKEGKASAQIISASLIEGQAQANVEPAVAKAHALGNELAWTLIAYRFNLKRVVPVKAVTYRVLAAEVAAKNVAKPDIWAARDVTLTAADRLTPVNVAIWDSGSDLPLFPGQVYTDSHPAPPAEPHGLAFDLENRPAHGYLMPLTPAQAAAYPGSRQALKGFSDLQLSLDTPEAAALKTRIAALKPDQVPAFFEQLSLFGNYVHGTHVAGITARGNPAIRLSVARLSFDWHNVPIRPNEDLVRRGAASYAAYVAWFKAHGVRVANMSWGGTPASYEDALEKNGVGKDAAERKAMARHFFEIDRDGLLAALKSAPDILFICAAGNADANSGFDESIPASFRLPNLLTVGAVDQAGDEASFTSYGDMVLVDANGYQVESYFPGGTKVRLSGTSMASPNTTNLAAKLLALDPKLTPRQVIRLIVDGATPSADGRRHNIDPRRSVALLRQRQASVKLPASPVSADGAIHRS